MAVPPLGFSAMRLDPGIRETVALLRGAGFNTCDSGDGVSKPKVGRDFDYPHVAVEVASRRTLLWRADRLLALLRECEPDGLRGWEVQATYNPGDGSCILFAAVPPRRRPVK